MQIMSTDYHKFKKFKELIGKINIQQKTDRKGALLLLSTVFVEIEDLQGQNPALAKRMEEYIRGRNQAQVKNKRPVGRPKRTNRPSKGAYYRTSPGEERYKITLRTEDIESMKKAAAAGGLSVKEAYAAAIGDYLRKHGFKSE